MSLTYDLIFSLVTDLLIMLQFTEMHVDIQQWRQKNTIMSSLYMEHKGKARLSGHACSRDVLVSAWTRLVFGAPPSDEMLMELCIKGIHPSLGCHISINGHVKPALQSAAALR